MEAFLEEFLIQTLAALGTLAGAVVAYYIRIGINRFDKSQDIIDAKELAVSVARFVEQVYNDANGKEKFEIAKQRFIDLVNEKGFNITEKQIETFIEEAVRELKDEYGNSWANFEE